MSSVSMISPGVFLEEIDKSYFTANSSSIAVGIVGGARKGPVGVPTLISTKNELISVFGEPINSDYGIYAALQVLNSTNKVYYQRVCLDKIFAKAGSESDKLNFTEKDTGTHLNDYVVSVTVQDNVVSIKLKDPDGAEVESWSALSLDPSSDNYIVKTLNGSSDYLDVVINVPGNLETKDFTFAGGEDLDLIAKANLEGSKISFKSKYPDSTLVDSRVIVSPISSKGYFSISFYKSNELVENYDYLTLDSNSTSYFVSQLEKSENLTLEIVSPFAPSSQDKEAEELTAWFNACVGSYKFTGGGNGISGLTADYIIGSSISATGINGFADPEAIKIDLLIVPGWSESTVITAAKNIVENRADCLYIMDPPFALPAQRAANWIDGKETNLYSHEEVDSSFVACYAPWGKVYDSFSRSNVWCPPSGFVAATLVASMDRYYRWSAPAGLTRGKITSVKELEYSPSRTQRDILYSSNINPIADFRTDGFCIWGQKTTQRIPSALDRVNVRLLLNYIKRVVGEISNNFVFESNSGQTWNSWRASVESRLDVIKFNGGISNYKVVMGSNITPQDIAEHKMPGIIYIQPVEVAEYIPISFVVYGSSVDFEEQVN